MKATVYKSTGSWYSVKSDVGKFFKARIKGVFKTDAITSTNPVAVGDEVNIVEEHDADDTVMINAIDERRNQVARQSPHSQHRQHIVAANLDQSLLICTLREPRTSQGFIDRFLVSCEAFHIPAIIVFNKADVYKAKEKALFIELQKMYTEIGYTVVLASVIKDEGVDEIKQLLLDKTTLLSGHSGVGKSTIINMLFPQYDLRTTEVSDWSGKGMHTTTFAEMFDLPDGGRIIDTPGVREFGLVNIEKNELAHYFPEMKRLINDCQFNNCMHINEPGCAVKKAVVTTVHEDRYVSYLTILDTMKEKTWS